MQLWIIGLFCVFTLWSYAPEVESSPLAGPPSAASGLESYHQNLEQGASFGDRMRRWFERVKKIFTGKDDSESSQPTGVARLMMELENEDPQERRRNKPKGFFLDLSTLTFDPDRDWGFRLGQWYFIRKTSNKTPSNASKSPNYPEWSTMDDAENVNMFPSTTTMKPYITTMPTLFNPTTQSTKSAGSTTPANKLTKIPGSTTPFFISTTIPTTKLSTTPAFTTTAMRNDSENETFRSSENPRSAEVLGPSG